MTDMRRDHSSLDFIKDQELSSKKIHDLLLSGKIALGLEDSRAQTIWNAIVRNEANSWFEFWKNGLFSFAKNHIPNKTDFGDHYRFELENFGHIARKIVTFPDLDSGKMTVFPKTFVDDENKESQLSEETLRLTWELALDVYQSSSDESVLPPEDLVISIELLKYPDSLEDLEKTFELINIGPQGKRRGIKLDLARSRARGPFTWKFLIDIFAWGCHIPKMGKIFPYLNSFFTNSPIDKISEDLQLVGPAHIDGFRYMSILLGDRDVMVTEGFNGSEWCELPLSTDKFTVFPGGASVGSSKIKPTLHRYSIKKKSPTSQERKPNLTLVIGISPKEFFYEKLKEMRNLV